MILSLHLHVLTNLPNKRELLQPFAEVPSKANFVRLFWNHLYCAKMSLHGTLFAALNHLDSFISTKSTVGGRGQSEMAGRERNDLVGWFASLK